MLRNDELAFMGFRKSLKGESWCGGMQRGVGYQGGMSDIYDSVLCWIGFDQQGTVFGEERFGVGLEAWITPRGVPVGVVEEAVLYVDHDQEGPWYCGTSHLCRFGKV